jgi:hypothetical protein
LIRHGPHNNHPKMSRGHTESKVMS